MPSRFRSKGATGLPTWSRTVSPQDPQEPQEPPRRPRRSPGGFVGQYFSNFFGVLYSNFITPMASRGRHGRKEGRQGITSRTPPSPGVGAAKRPRGREQAARHIMICSYPASFSQKPMGFWAFLTLWTGSYSSLWK